MPVPILKLGHILIATIQTELADSEWDLLGDSLLDRVGRFRTRGVVIDVSAMDLMDSFAARALRTLATMLRLRGAETVIVGIQPEVAQAMAQLGLRMTEASTALDLEEGIELLRAKVGVPRV